METVSAELPDLPPDMVYFSVHVSVPRESAKQHGDAILAAVHEANRLIEGG